MRLREHINKAVFGVVAAALQLLPGQGKAEDSGSTCPEEEATLHQMFDQCMQSESTACECLDCLQESAFTGALQVYEDCLGHQSLLTYCGFFTTFCNTLPGGELHQSGQSCSSGSGSGSGSGGSSSSSGN